MAREAYLQHIRKAGAFSTGELNEGEFGIDTANQDVYFSTNGTNAIQIAGGGGGVTTSDIVNYDSAITSFYGNGAAYLCAIATTGLSAGFKQIYNEISYGEVTFELEAEAATRTTISSVATGTDTITAAGSPSLSNYQQVLFHTSDTLPDGLNDTTAYYAFAVSGLTFKVASSRANAEAATAVDITDSGTGTHEIFALDHPNKIIPDDYDHTTNQKIWNLREDRPPVTFQKQFFADATDLTASTIHWMYMPKNFRLQEIFAQTVTWSGADAAIQIRVDGVDALFNDLVIGNAVSHGGGREGSYTFPYQFEQSLWTPSKADHIELRVTDIGDSSGTANQGLIVTMIGHYSETGKFFNG